MVHLKEFVMKKMLMASVVLLASSVLAQASVYTLQNDGVTNPVADGYVFLDIYSSPQMSGNFTNPGFCTGVSQGNSTYVGLVKFTLPTGITAADVQSATLSLYSFWNAGTVYVYQLAAGANWNTNATYTSYDGANAWPDANSSGSTQVGASAITSTVKSVSVPTSGWVDVDVTDIVKNWSNGQTNNGFILQSFNWVSSGWGSGNAPMLGFNSSEYSTDYALTPKLTIVPEPMSLALIGLGALVLRRKIA
jgi:hypothetical protein